MTVEQLARKIAEGLSAKSGEPEKAEILTFGLQLIIGELAKFILLVLLGVVLNKLLAILLLQVLLACLGLFQAGCTFLPMKDACLLLYC